MAIHSQHKVSLPDDTQADGPVPHAHTKNSRWRVFFVAWALLSIMAAVWAIATPVSAAPDEPAHIIKAASVVRGQFIGTAAEGGQKVEVPAYIAFTPAQTCYAFNEQVSAKCSPTESGDHGAIVSSTTSAGLYNPTYYLIVGWPSLLFHDDTGIYAMRFVSGIISSLFLAVTLMLISTWRRRLLPLLGFAVAATPMLFFLNGVVNPNSLEVAATLAAFVGVVSIVLHRHDSLTVERCAIVMVSAALAANTRGISPVWVAIALFAPFLLVPWSQVRELAKLWAVRGAIIGIGLATGAALSWTLLSNSLGTGISNPSHAGADPAVGVSSLRGFMTIFDGTFDYGKGLIGVFGWLDTQAPPTVFFLWSIFIGTPVLAALIFLKGRPFAFVLTLVALLLVLPPSIQALYAPAGGIIWQGRYALALYGCVAVGTVAVLSDRIPNFEPKLAFRTSILVCALWFAAQFHAFITALKRYTVGGVGAPGATWQRVVLDPLWSPPGGTIPLLAAYVVVFAVGAILLSRLATSPNNIDVDRLAVPTLPRARDSRNRSTSQ